MAHAILVISNPTETPSDIGDRAKTARDSFTPVLPSQEQPVDDFPADLGRSAHVRGLYRFDDSDDKASIIDQFTEDAFAGVEWYVIKSHVCTHDSADGGLCPGWTVERERGNVPDEFL